MGIFRRLAKKSPVPDFEFAARGFAQVAITRLHAPQIDLHSLELGFAEELLREGCSVEQAMSARWGGTYAITADLREFREAIEAFKDTMQEQYGRRTFETKAEAESAYRAAAVCLIGTAHAFDPNEYGRFLAYVGAK